VRLSDSKVFGNIRPILARIVQEPALAPSLLMGFAFVFGLALKSELSYLLTLNYEMQF